MKKIIIISILLIFFFSINVKGIPTTGTFTPLPPPNQVPVQSNHLIWNGLTEKSLNATDVNVSSISINFTITDINANSMDWYIYHNASGTWKLVDSGIGVYNGSKITTNVSWFRQLTNYSISFNVTDGSLWANETHWFVTDYSVPYLSGENPSNGSIITTSSCSWSINITDYTIFNWTINCSSGDNSSGNMSTNGTFYLNMTGLTTASYTVWVNVTNGNMSINHFFIFTVIISAVTPGRGEGWVPPPEEDIITEEVVTHIDDSTMIITGVGIIILFSIFLWIIVAKRRKEGKRA